MCDEMVFTDKTDSIVSWAYNVTILGASIWQLFPAVFTLHLILYGALKGNGTNGQVSKTYTSSAGTEIYPVPTDIMSVRAYNYLC